MDTEAYSDISPPSSDESMFTSYGSGMFAGTQHFTISGGIFNNSTYLTAPAAPAGFRMLPMGDIDLQRELIVNTESGVVESRRERSCLRRVYSARVTGRNLNVTVAIYQGDGAEEDWRKDTEMYMSVRHPNIIQTWAGASYGNVHATVFHGDLVPLRAFLARQSPIMTVYLYAVYTNEWSRVEDHFQSLGTAPYPWECTMWIRSSTGRLSVDPALGTGDEILLEGPQISTPSDPSNVTDVIAIESLGLSRYHNVCSFYLLQARADSISASTTVDIGAVMYWPSHHGYEEHVDIALLTESDVHYGGWQTQRLTQNGWSRYRVEDVSDPQFFLTVYLNDAEAWLSQANHIFSRLRIMSGLEEYKFLRRIFFRLTIAEAGRAPPAGFLFLCPMEHFQTGPTSFRWPNRPAYWSLDSKGLEALSTVEAARLGFPPFQLTTIVVGKFWDASVYAGLRQFHQAKGFDPDSQEIAIHLGQPLFRLSKDVNPPFAHVDDRFEERPDEELEYIYEDDTDEDITSINDDAHAEDGECSFRDFNRKESDTEGNDARVDGQLEARAQPHNVPREVHQEPNGCNSSRTDQQTHTGPQIANEGATGGDLVRRFFWQLQQGLLPTETDNIDTYLISPFPI